MFSEYRIRDTDEFVFRYRGRLLRVPRSKVRIEAADTLVYSLIFALVTEPPAQRDLVVQLDEHCESEFTKPADPRKTCGGATASCIAVNVAEVRTLQIRRAG